MKKAVRYILILLGGIIVGGCIVAFTKIPSEVGVSDKYDILVDILLIMLALLAAAGYVIYRMVLQGVETHIKGVATKVENIWNIRERINVGYDYWEQSKTGAFREKLDAAISITEEALYMNPSEEDECLIKNNLAFYYAVRGLSEDILKAKDYAKYIKEKAPAYDSLAIACLITYGFVLAKHPASPQEKEEAKLFFERLLKRGDLTVVHKGQIENHLATLWSI